MNKSVFLKLATLSTIVWSAVSVAGVTMPAVQQGKLLASGAPVACSASDSVESCRLKADSNWAVVSGGCEFGHMWHTTFACVNYSKNAAHDGFTCSWQSPAAMPAAMIGGMETADMVCNTLPHPTSAPGGLTHSELHFVTPVQLSGK